MNSTISNTYILCTYHIPSDFKHKQHDCVGTKKCHKSATKQNVCKLLLFKTPPGRRKNCLDLAIIDMKTPPGKCKNLVN